MKIILLYQFTKGLLPTSAT